VGPLWACQSDALADGRLRLSHFGYQRRGGKARLNAGPSPLYTTGRGARVARQRCPILRTGRNRVPDVPPIDNLSAGTHKAINA